MAVRVEVVYSAGPRHADVTDLCLPPGSTVGDAFAASGLRLRYPELPDAPALGVWGRSCGTDRALSDGDRVELYRPLQIDPKDARRARSKRQAIHHRTARAAAAKR